MRRGRKGQSMFSLLFGPSDALHMSAPSHESETLSSVHPEHVRGTCLEGLRVSQHVLQTVRDRLEEPYRISR